MNNLALNGCRIAYEIKGKEHIEKPAVLFLHGWGCDHTFFGRFADEVSAEYTAVSVDFPGHGESDEPACAWSVSDYAAQISALMDHLCIKKACLVGHSFGCRVSIRLASSQPDRITGMLLTGAAGIRKQMDGRQSDRQKQYQKLKAIALAVGKLPFLGKLSGRLMDGLRQKYGSADYNRLSPNMRGTFVKVVNEDLTPLLSSVLAPVMLVWGSADTETPLWMGQKMKELIPDSGLAVFEGRSHFAFLEEPDRFMSILSAFLKETNNG